jgi:hypothetical protein
VNQTLEKIGFAEQVWTICEPAYANAAKGGRPGIDPVVYLKMLMVGFFENLPSEHSIASRCADSLSIRGFLGYGLTDATPDHSKKFNAPLSDQRYQLDEELARIQAEIDVLKIDNISSERLVTKAMDLHSRWPEMSLEEKPREAELMVRSMVVGDGEIEFNLVHLPSYQEFTNWQNRYPRAHRAGHSSRGNAAAVPRGSDARLQAE